jgi:hypothetical protein
MQSIRTSGGVSHLRRRSAGLVATLFAILALMLAPAVALAPAAHAAPCTTCPEPPEPEPGPHPPSGPVKKWKLDLDSVERIDGQDGPTDFNDEIYLKVDGVKVWGPTGISAIMKPVGVEHYKVFVNYVGIEVWDDDDFNDDRIGTILVFPPVLPAHWDKDEYAMHLHGAGAHYVVRYKVWDCASWRAGVC